MEARLPAQTTDLDVLPTLLLDWYDSHARDLPWRTGPAARRAGERPNPYHVWLCEIMMQQTTIPHGTPYFLKFIGRWPTIEDLASAKDEDVMAAWAGLGYYARARNLLKCAREVAKCGSFPETETELRKLPGIGPYTAGAIAALAFGQPAAAIDGNVERVFSRLLAMTGDWKTEKKRIAETVRALVPPDHPGAFAEALMDLGATLCTPTKPNCMLCPVTTLCAGRASGEPERFPIKPAKTPKPKRHGRVFILTDKNDIWLTRLPPRGLLGGMLALPSDGWRGEDYDPDRAFPATAKDWQNIGEVRHVFTHFSLTLDVYSGELDGKRPDGEWTPIKEVDGLPSVFAKALRLLKT